MRLVHLPRIRGSYATCECGWKKKYSTHRGALTGHAIHLRAELAKERTRWIAEHELELKKTLIGGWTWQCSCGAWGNPTSRHPHSQGRARAAHARHASNSVDREIQDRLNFDVREYYGI